MNKYRKTFKIKRDNTQEKEKIYEAIKFLVTMVGFFTGLYYLSWSLYGAGLL